MSNPLGGMSSPTPVSGNANQKGLMSGIFGQLYGPNGQLQGVPAYTGQLTPDVNNTILPSVWNSWSSFNNALGGGGGSGSGTTNAPTTSSQQIPLQASNPWSHSMMPWGGGGMQQSQMRPPTTWMPQMMGGVGSPPPQAAANLASMGRQF